ncbi:alpha/beta hydrolase [Listeria costaricensis]|uniref:alpha/beta hydrolase n=1 Tax=Listeria costaricensis TaxID=2026604 RepID=UPI0013C4B80D|nr:alpha/beta hydrolase [Listeria costaricensis]
MSKRLIAALLAVVVLVSAAMLTLHFTQQKAAEKPAAVDLSKQVPIIAIHGTGGGTYTFDEAREALTRRGEIRGELAVTVRHDQSLEFSGSLDQNAQHPFISIAFEENEAEPSEWANGLTGALKELKRLYQFKEVDALGYSNGGLALVDYLEKPESKTGLPDMRRLIVLGAPFNDLDMEQNEEPVSADDTEEHSDMLDDLLSKKNQIPASLEVLSVAGNLEDTDSDGIVPLESALSSRLIFEHQAKDYQEIVLTSPDADHGNLPDLPEVTDLMERFFIHSQQVDSLDLQIDS